MMGRRYRLGHLAAAAVVITALTYAASPLAQLLTQRYFREHVDSEFTAEQVEVGFFPPRLTYSDVRVEPLGSVAREGRNRPLTAQSVDLVFDSAELLRRRAVVHAASVKGLVLETQTPIEILAADRQPTNPVPSYDQSADAADKASAALGRLLDMGRGVDGSIEERAAAIAERFETQRRSDQIRRRWKGEYALLTQRAAELEAVVAALQEAAERTENPLRDRPRTEAALARAKEIRGELAEVRRALEDLPARVQGEILTLDAARQNDLRALRELEAEIGFDSELLGGDLLSGPIAAWIDNAARYLETGRELSQGNVFPPPAPRRGRRVNLAGRTTPPAWLVRRLEVEGTLLSAKRPYELTGIIENLSPQREMPDGSVSLALQPVVARLRLEGESTVRLEYKSDPSSADAKETLTLHLPEADASTLRIGDDAVGLDICGGRGELWVRLTKNGDQLEGRLVSCRTAARIQLIATDTNEQRSAVLSAMQAGFAGVDRVEVDAAFSLDAQQLRLDVETNLDGILQKTVRDAAASRTAAIRQRLEGELEQLYAARVSGLQQWLAGQQSETRDVLARADATVQELSERLLDGPGRAEAYLGIRGRFPTRD